MTRYPYHVIDGVVASIVTFVAYGLGQARAARALEARASGVALGGGRAGNVVRQAARQGGGQHGPSALCMHTKRQGTQYNSNTSCFRQALLKNADSPYQKSVPPQLPWPSQISNWVAVWLSSHDRP